MHATAPSASSSPRPPRPSPPAADARRNPSAPPAISGSGGSGSTAPVAPPVAPPNGAPAPEVDLAELLAAEEARLNSLVTLLSPYVPFIPENQRADYQRQTEYYQTLFHERDASETKHLRATLKMAISQRLLITMTLAKAGQTGASSAGVVPHPTAAKAAASTIDHMPLEQLKTDLSAESNWLTPTLLKRFWPHTNLVPRETQLIFQKLVEQERNVKQVFLTKKKRLLDQTKTFLRILAQTAENTIAAEIRLKEEPFLLSKLSCRPYNRIWRWRGNSGSRYSS